MDDQRKDNSNPKRQRNNPEQESHNNMPTDDVENTKVTN